MLTQSEADTLVLLPKKLKINQSYTFPNPGEILTIDVVAEEGGYDFLIDVNRGFIRLTKCTYQERFKTADILIRLDIDGPPHTNPMVNKVPLPYLTPYNGQTIECPHVHHYVQDYMDKWAIPIPKEKFPNINNLIQTFYDFLIYCNIKDKPSIAQRTNLDEY